MSFADSPREQLGKLAQSARSNNLKTIRTILIIIGVLTILVNLVQIGMAKSLAKQAVDAEIQRQGGGPVNPVDRQQVEEQIVKVLYVACGVLVAVGALYLVFAAIVHIYPVPVTIMALVIYVAAAVIFAIFDPRTLLQGLIIKLLIVVALAKGIQTAVAYQKELDEERRGQHRPAEDTEEDSEVRFRYE